jgi:hypothetical protein
MSFGGRGSSYEWQKGLSSRHAPARLQMPYDQLVRGLIGQMAEPPETPISTPLQQAISNLQSGDPSRAFGLGGGMASRLSGASTSTAPSASGTDAAGFAPGSFSPNAPGGPSGLQSREQLGLPDRKSYFPFMPSADDIEAIGLAPVRSQKKATNELRDKIDRLQTKIDVREAAGKGHGKADKKLEKVKTRLGAQPTAPSYR